MTDKTAPQPVARPGRVPTEDITYVAKRRVSCSGSGGALGHPQVWYALDDGDAVCGYCDRRFVFDPEKAGAA